MIFIFFTLSFILAQREKVNAQPPETILQETDVVKLNAQVTELSKAKKYDEALPIANRSLELTRANPESSRALIVALTNLAMLQKAKTENEDGTELSENTRKRLLESISLFNEAIKIQIKAFGEETGDEAIMRTELGRLHIKLQNYNEAENELKRALTIRDNRFGSYSKQSFDSLKNLADFYFKEGSLKDALKYYKNALAIGEGAYLNNQSPLIPLLENYIALLMKMNKTEDANKLTERVKLIQIKERSTDTSSVENLLNGKAIRLEIPTYPRTVFNEWFAGTIVVDVVIDEKGKVIKAAARNGPPSFRTAAEDAAKKSKFSSTLLNGKPVTVTGQILYNFLPR